MHCTNLIIGMAIVWAVGFWLARDADAFRLALPGVAALQLGGLALVADPLVPLVFGNAWRPSVAPLALLAAFTPAYALALIAG
ncbi:MAG TPA: hypothetical protein PKA98_17955, partial [Acidimicrobiales bacterium]|nr:hypothetical protein [Acidimicrobiales bacterium]